MAKKNAAKNSTTQLADDVLFGARVLYRELDDIFGHVSGRLPPGAKREGLLFARMRIAPKPLDPDEVMEIDFSCRRINRPAATNLSPRIYSVRQWSAAFPGQPDQHRTGRARSCRNARPRQGADTQKSRRGYGRSKCGRRGGQDVLPGEGRIRAFDSRQRSRAMDAGLDLPRHHRSIVQISLAHLALGLRVIPHSSTPTLHPLHVLSWQSKSLTVPRWLTSSCRLCPLQTREPSTQR